MYEGMMGLRPSDIASGLMLSAVVEAALRAEAESPGFTELFADHLSEVSSGELLGSECLRRGLQPEMIRRGMQILIDHIRARSPEPGDHLRLVWPPQDPGDQGE